MTFELNKEKKMASLGFLFFFLQTSITLTLMVKTVIREESWKSSNIKGYIDLPYFKDDNLIVSPVDKLFTH